MIRKVLTVIIALTLPLQVCAISAEDNHAVTYDITWYSESSNCSENIAFGPGSLPTSVPQPYNQIFTAAATKFNIEPALVAGIFYGGEHGNSFPEPPPPYGHGQPWATSYAAAQGPFQFLGSTWEAYGVDGNGDGDTDIQDLTDGAFGAAHYLAESGAKPPNPDLHKAIFAYNHAEWYVANVMAAYAKFGGGGATPDTSPSNNNESTDVPTSSCGAVGSVEGYKNPLRDVQALTRKRIDQGVDYGGHGPIYAIGNGKVGIATTSSGWPGGNYISYQLSDGPAKGKWVYFAESCSPKVSVGDQVTADTVICDMHGDFSPWTETGWATDPSQGNLAMAHSVYNEGDMTAFGINFSELLQKLGAPPGVKEKPVVTGSLPSGWPQW